MSRSRKRYPAASTTTADSEKEDKQREGRRRRRHVRAELLQTVYFLEREVALSPDPRRTGTREFAKDGKVRVSPGDPEDRIRRLRK